MTTFQRRALEFKEFFIKRGYNQMEIDKAILQAASKTREALLQYTERIKTDRVPCVVTYHPKLNCLSTILKKHFHILQDDANCSKAFANPPMVAYRKLKNIKDYVVRTDLQRNPPQKAAKNMKCNRPRCLTCPIFQETNLVTNTITKRTVPIKTPGNCVTSNCVYGITCQRCKKIYIGETGGPLSVRINNHRQDIKVKRPGVETAHHFNSTGHTVKDMEVTVLAHNPEWTVRERELEEDSYMCKLKSLHPHGINRRAGDLVRT
jgi:hypothetical protein